MDNMDRVKLMLKIENIQEDLNYLITESNIKDRYALELLFKVNVQATQLNLLMKAI